MASVALFTSADLSVQRREAATRAIHRVADIAEWKLEIAFLDTLEEHTTRNTRFELVRNDGQLYVTGDTTVIEGTLARCSLASAESA